MSMTPSTLERFRPHSVPVCVFAVVVAAVVIVPPLVLDLTPRTYAIAAAVLILAVSSTAPYAVAVAVLTLPSQYLGLASYASPRTVPDDGRPSLVDALRHAGAGSAYVLAAGAVGGIGVGVDVASSSSASTPPTGVPFTYLAGGVVGVVFVGLQLWRHDDPESGFDARTTFGTIALGLLLVPAGRVALWLFGHGPPV
jgi:hypothetical protein